MIRIDHHNHILLAEITEMVAAAKASEVREFSITEHVSQFGEPRMSVGFGSVHSSGRIFETLKEYRDEFRKVDDRAGLGMKVNQGLEVDFSPRYEKTVGDFVNQEEWDMLLCSVHEFEDGRDIEKGAGPVDPALANERWRDYLRLERMALESDFVPFTVLSHPVRLSRGTKTVPPELDELLLDLARIAQRRNRALELNGNDIDNAPGLVHRLATACSMAGCKVSLGSDAHHPRDVFRNMRVAMALVNEFNLETI